MDALLITWFMPNIGELFPEEEWRALDWNLGWVVVNERSPVQGKIKGVVLNDVLGSIRQNGGSDATSNTRKRKDLEESFKAKVWYPIDILTSILDDLEGGKKNGHKSSREMGAYINHYHLEVKGQHLLGSPETSFPDCLLILWELFDLLGFAINRVNGGTALEFRGVVNESFNQFLAGICEGEAILRNLSVMIRIMESDRDGLSKIMLTPRIGGGTDAV